MLVALIWIIVLIAAAAIVFWFLKSVSIPAPFNIIVYAVIAIIALILLAIVAQNLTGGNLDFPRIR